MIRFEVTVPSDPSAGMMGFTETVTVSLDSGDPGGEPGEFAAYLYQTLRDWYDGGRIDYIQEEDDHVVVAFLGKGRVVLADFELQHFQSWAASAVLDQRIRESIYRLLYSHPDLLKTHSWPEIRNLAERNDELGLS